MTLAEPGEISLPQLRKMPDLSRKVNKQMSFLGLVSDSTQSDDSDSSGKDYTEALVEAPVVKKSKRKKCKSGLYKKSSDSVLFPQIWPHSALQYEYVSESVDFMSLDIKTFVAGELEIILGKRIPAAEKLGRLRFLKKIMYLANTYEWSALLKFYAAWVRRIEVGLTAWSDDPSEIENLMLAKYPLKNRFQSKKSATYLKEQDQIWWCADYNKQRCSFSSSTHQKSVKGHMRQVKHICGACYRADKKQLEHPESSSACPYRK